MKKKLIFLFIFVVSLFIYCNKVDAVVMWRDCGKVHYIYKDVDYKVLHDSEDQYNLYFVKMKTANGDSGIYAFLTNDDGSIRPGREVNPNHYFWYENEFKLPASGKNGIIDDSIVIGDVIDEGICPETVVYYKENYSDYQSLFSFDDSYAGHHFDFAGTKKNLNVYSSMDNYQLVIYDMKDGERDSNSTVLEAYDSDGSYGLAISGKMGEVASRLNILTAIGNSLTSAFTTFDFYYIDAKSQITLAKLMKGDKDYFNLTDRNKKLLFGDLATFIILNSHVDGTGGALTNNYYNTFPKSSDFLRVGGYHAVNKSFDSIDDAYDFSVSNGILTSALNGNYDVKTINDSDLSLVDELSFRYVTKKSTYIWPEVTKWAEDIEHTLSEKEKLYLEIFDDRNDSKGKYYDSYKSIMEMGKKIDSGKSNLFSANYDYNQLITNMENIYDNCNKLLYSSSGSALNEFPTYKDDCSNVTYASLSDDKSDPRLSSLTSTMMCKLFDVPYNKFPTLGGVDVRTTAMPTFKSAMKDQIKLYENLHPEFKVSNYTTDIRELLISMVKVGTYIQDRVAGYSANENKKLNDIIENCNNILRNQYEVELIIDCESLIDEQLMNRLSKYLDIIKIAVPLLLLVFGILDFAKAMFAGDDDKMKKAQKNFIMRVIIAVLFFLSPLIVQLILRIANKAWDFITPNVCNIFSGE